MTSHEHELDDHISGHITDDITDDVTIEGTTGFDGSVVDFLNDDLADTGFGLTDDPDKDSAFAKIDGNEIDRVFQVADGATLQLLRVAVLNGRTEGEGGGIRNDGSLRLDRVAVIDNEAVGQSFNDGGGGVYNTGAMSATDFVFAHNTAPAGNSTGGAVRNFGTANLTRGLLAYDYALNGSELSNSPGAVLSATDITVTGNPSPPISEVVIHVVRNFGEMEIRHATFDGHNRARVILFNQSDATMTLGNSLLLDDDGQQNCSGPIESFGGNVTRDSCDLVTALDPSFDHIDVLVSTAGGLLDEGGFSPVHPFNPQPPSSAVFDPSDVGSPAVRQSFTDQRGTGFPRAIDRDGDGDAIADAGAWEHPG